jgi:hypothetical protein
MIPWVEWLKSITGDQSVTEICLKIGTSRATFNRWMTVEKPPCMAVIKLAVAYNGDVIVGLVLSGHLPESYVREGIEQRLQHVPVVFLTNELARRDAAGEMAPPLRPGWEQPTQ